MAQRLVVQFLQPQKRLVVMMQCAVLWERLAGSDYF